MERIPTPGDESDSKSELEKKEPLRIQGKRPDEYLKMLREAGATESAQAFEVVVAIAQLISRMGGKAMMVGGAVRDELMETIPNDFDIEVYGVSEEEVKKILKKLGNLEECGQIYGIFKLRVAGADIDVSLPRKERSTGKGGHKDIEAEIIEDLPFDQAAKRRDITINAFMKDILTGEVLDFFGGLDDIRHMRLRMVSKETFGEDPLRPMRIPQFAGRFGFFVDEETRAEVEKIQHTLFMLPKDRIRKEWLKLLMSKKPSIGLSTAMGLGIIETLYKDEVIPLTHTEQDKTKHPEGTAWMHTIQVVDSARRIIDMLNGLSEQERQTILLAAFCHDFGKPKTTQKKDQKIISYGHEEAGIEPSEIFLEKIGVKKKIKDKVLKIIKCHRRALDLLTAYQKGEISHRMIRRLTLDVFPASIKELMVVAVADSMGRVGLSNSMRESYIDPKDLRSIEELHVISQKEIDQHNRPKQAVLGRELIQLGIMPDSKNAREFGELLTLINTLIDSGGIEKERVLGEVKKQKTKPVEAICQNIRKKFEENRNR